MPIRGKEIKWVSSHKDSFFRRELYLSIRATVSFGYTIIYLFTFDTGIHLREGNHENSHGTEKTFRPNQKQLFEPAASDRELFCFKTTGFMDAARP